MYLKIALKKKFSDVSIAKKKDIVQISAQNQKKKILEEIFKSQIARLLIIRIQAGEIIVLEDGIAIKPKEEKKVIGQVGIIILHGIITIKMMMFGEVKMMEMMDGEEMLMLKIMMVMMDGETLLMKKNQIQMKILLGEIITPLKKKKMMPGEAIMIIQMMDGGILSLIKVKDSMQIKVKLMIVGGLTMIKMILGETIKIMIRKVTMKIMEMDLGGTIIMIIHGETIIMIIIIIHGEMINLIIKMMDGIKKAMIMDGEAIMIIKKITLGGIVIIMMDSIKGKIIIIIKIIHITKIIIIGIIKIMKTKIIITGITKIMKKKIMLGGKIIIRIITMTIIGIKNRIILGEMIITKVKIMVGIKKAIIMMVGEKIH